MKKAFMILAAFFGISSLAGAQGFFIGGSFGFNANNHKYQNYDDGNGSYEDEVTGSDNSIFKFAPVVGYSINDDWEIAAAFEFYVDKDKLDNKYDAPEKYKYFEAELSGRRYFALGDKFSWFIEAGVYFDKSAGEDFSKDDGKITGDTYYEKNYGAYIVPGLCYELNDHWSVDLNFNFMNLSYDICKYNSEDIDGNPCYSKGTHSNFDFSGTTAPGSIRETANLVSLGFYYAF